MQRHPTDPPHLYEFAERLGELVANGDLSDEGARETVKTVVQSTQHEHQHGLQCRLLWTVGDTIRDIKSRQVAIDQQLIRRACRALLATDRKADADQLARLLLTDAR